MKEATEELLQPSLNLGGSVGAIERRLLRQAKDLRRPKTKPKEVVKEEVVQFIRPDLAFGALRRLAGAAAITMHSLFEEQLVAEQMAAHTHMGQLENADAEASSAARAGGSAPLRFTKVARSASCSAFGRFVE